MIYPESDQKDRGKIDPGEKMATESLSSSDLLNQARLVLKWAPELAQEILNGGGRG
jgi:hypothetical protein